MKEMEYNADAIGQDDRKQMLQNLIERVHVHFDVSDLSGGFADLLEILPRFRVDLFGLLDENWSIVPTILFIRCVCFLLPQLEMTDVVQSITDHIDHSMMQPDFLDKEEFKISRTHLKTSCVSNALENSLFGSKDTSRHQMYDCLFRGLVEYISQVQHGHGDQAIKSLEYYLMQYRNAYDLVCGVKFTESCDLFVIHFVECFLPVDRPTKENVLGSLYLRIIERVNDFNPSPIELNAHLSRDNHNFKSTSVIMLHVDASELGEKNIYACSIAETLLLYLYRKKQTIHQCFQNNLFLFTKYLKDNESIAYQPGDFEGSLPKAFAKMPFHQHLQSTIRSSRGVDASGKMRDAYSYTTKTSENNTPISSRDQNSYRKPQPSRTTKRPFKIAPNKERTVYLSKDSFHALSTNEPSL